MIQPPESGCRRPQGWGASPKAIIPVDMFGQPADHQQYGDRRCASKIFVLDDAAQGLATYQNQRVGMALATATSFFPAKPLGCYGDGGGGVHRRRRDRAAADAVACTARAAHRHQAADRLQRPPCTIQAAVLIEKLRIFS